VENSQWKIQPHLVLAGEGQLYDVIKDWRRKLNFPDNVKLLGFHENIADFYNEISLLAMPSLAEGFGLAAAEALACEVPVIATDSSSLPEIVIHEKTGLLVPVNNPDVLAKAIIRLLSEYRFATEMGQAGRKHIMANFTSQKTLAKLLQLTERTS